MKKTLQIVILAGLFVWLGSSLALAVPFQISGSELDLNWNSGGGLVSYTDYSMTEAVNLEVGESFDFTFGKIEFPLAFGSGSADLSVSFATPDPVFSVGGQATFNVWSLFVISGGSLIFGEPVAFEYSYDGLSGGIFTLALHDIVGSQSGFSTMITGTITNNVAPVPEPGTLLLLGAGLAGLALYRRKRMNQ